MPTISSITSMPFHNERPDALQVASPKGVRKRTGRFQKVPEPGTLKVLPNALVVMALRS